MLHKWPGHLVIRPALYLNYGSSPQHLQFSRSLLSGLSLHSLNKLSVSLRAWITYHPSFNLYPNCPITISIQNLIRVCPRTLYRHMPSRKTNWEDEAAREHSWICGHRPYTTWLQLPFQQDFRIIAALCVPPPHSPVLYLHFSIVSSRWTVA